MSSGAPITALPWELCRIPDSCRGVDIVIGIDEAGRGPVLGSLVYAAAFWPVSEDESIRKMGFNDSKQLKESDREQFFESIRNHPSIGWIIEDLSPEFLSNNMLRRCPTSLNTLSYDAVVRMLRKISRGDSSVGHVESRPKQGGEPVITDIYVDTVGDPNTYRSRLEANLGKDFGHFVIEKKADATYKVVGAASIIAKVHRDATLRNWKWAESSVQLNKNFGCGYPSDPACIEWLKGAQQHVFGFPNLVRFSWSTSRDALESGQACKILWECEEDDAANSSHDITDFFSARGASKKVKRASFFTQRKMRHISSQDLSIL